MRPGRLHAPAPAFGLALIRCAMFLRGRLRGLASSWSPKAVGDSHSSAAWEKDAATDTGELPLPPLNKAAYQEAATCLRLGWFRRRRLVPEEKLGDTEMFLIEQGKAFEADFISSSYRSGVEIPPWSSEKAAAETKKQMQRIEAEHEGGGGWEDGEEQPALFQAVFLADGVVARADVVEYAGDGQWDIVEVKSCSETSTAKYHYDVAFTCAAARRSGAKGRTAVITEARFRRVDCTRKTEARFRRVDCTREVLGGMGALSTIDPPRRDESDPLPQGSIAEVLEKTGNRGRSWTGVPELDAQNWEVAESHCKKCPMFKECVGANLTHPLWERYEK
ncbi:hypothetical protein T484DRAFT_1801644 [Baffinella frigidus]|nr:hypothetical protein T484DRAFT_1801644 [Cryptophyta sp. CCMP2293]